jgi:hypothetical protein
MALRSKKDGVRREVRRTKNQPEWGDGLPGTKDLSEAQVFAVGPTSSAHCRPSAPKRGSEHRLGERHGDEALLAVLLHPQQHRRAVCSAASRTARATSSGWVTASWPTMEIRLPALMPARCAGLPSPPGPPARRGRRRPGRARAHLRRQRCQEEPMRGRPRRPRRAWPMARSSLGMRPMVTSSMAGLAAADDRQLDLGAGVDAGDELGEVAVLQHRSPAAAG